MSRRALLPIVAVVAALSALPTTAAAGPVFPTANDDASGLVMHERPDAGSPRTGKVPSGGQVEVFCQTTGTRQSDPKYGTSSLWDRVRNVADGRVGFVTDLYVLSNQDRIAGVPPCGAAPSPPPPPPPPPGGSQVGGPISRAEVLARSLPWIERHVMYSQSKYTDGKRQDCSGYMSLVWNLAGSPNSKLLRSPAYTKVIPRGQLQPGDMLGHPGHVALFVRWAPGGRAVVREEWDNGHPAEERTWSARYTSQNTAYRYKRIR